MVLSLKKTVAPTLEVPTLLLRPLSRCKLIHNSFTVPQYKNPLNSGHRAKGIVDRHCHNWDAVKCRTVSATSPCPTK
jgi:hypothetical protein